MQVAARLQYGCTWINSHFMLVSEMPHGGHFAASDVPDLFIEEMRNFFGQLRDFRCPACQQVSIWGP
eukprot:gene57579-76871_t